MKYGDICKYRIVYDTPTGGVGEGMGEGVGEDYCIVEVIRDNYDETVDIRIIEVDPNISCDGCEVGAELTVYSEDLQYIRDRNGVDENGLVRIVGSDLKLGDRVRVIRNDKLKVDGWMEIQEPVGYVIGLADMSGLGSVGGRGSGGVVGDRDGVLVSVCRGNMEPFVRVVARKYLIIENVEGDRLGGVGEGGDGEGVGEGVGVPEGSFVTIKPAQVLEWLRGIGLSEECLAEDGKVLGGLLTGLCGVVVRRIDGTRYNGEGMVGCEDDVWECVYFPGITFFGRGFGPVGRLGDEENYSIRGWQMGEVCNGFLFIPSKKLTLVGIEGVGGVECSE